MTSVLTIGGMLSVHSVRAVFTALAAVPGISRAQVQLGRAEVEHAAPLAIADLRHALNAPAASFLASMRAPAFPSFKTTPDTHRAAEREEPDPPTPPRRTATPSSGSYNDNQ